MPNWVVIMQAVVATFQALAPEAQALIQEIANLINGNQPVPPAKMTQLQAIMKAHGGLVEVANTITMAAAAN